MIEHDNGQVIKNSRKRFPVVSLPEIVTSPIYQRWQRYVQGNATGASITIGGILQAFMIASSTTNLVCYVKAVRIKKIRVLAPVTTQGTSVSLLLRPNMVDTGSNNFNAVPEVYLDTSASIDIPAYISLEPSLDTPLGSWHMSTATSGNLVYIEAPVGSTMDILFEFILNTSDTASALNATVGGATAGTLYTRYINNFQPLGVNYI